MRFAFVLLASFGCAAATPGPRGPLSGRGLDLAGDYSYAYGPGEATLPDGTVARGAADNFWGDLTIFPRRIETRLSPVSWMDLGVQLGWLGGGIDARVGRAAIDNRTLAFQLAGGLESGALGPFKDTKVLRSRWVRLEAYPLFSDGKVPWRLVLAVGLNAGTFYHQVPDPRPDTTRGDGVGFRAIQLVRPETRIETALGVQCALRKAAFLFAVQPYWVIDADPALVDCAGCEPIAAYRQSWGVVAVLRLALRFHPFGLK